MQVAVRAVVVNAEWDVAHQRNSASLRVRPCCDPLVECDPLDVFEKRFAFGKALPDFGGPPGQPVARRISAAMLLAPLVPGLAVSIFLHECAEKRVIAQPTVFRLAKEIEVRRIAFAFGTPARKPRVGFFQET